MCFTLETEYYAVKKKPSKKDERIKLKFLRVNKLKRAFIIISNYFSWAQFSVRRPISANPGLNIRVSFFRQPGPPWPGPVQYCNFNWHLNVNTLVKELL